MRTRVRTRTEYDDIMKRDAWFEFELFYILPRRCGSWRWSYRARYEWGEFKTNSTDSCSCISLTLGTLRGRVHRSASAMLSLTMPCDRLHYIYLQTIARCLANSTAGCGYLSKKGLSGTTGRTRRSRPTFHNVSRVADGTEVQNFMISESRPPAACERP